MEGRACRTAVQTNPTTMKKLLSVAALALVAAAPLSAQGITGTWITEFDRMVRNEGGTVTTGDKARAKMTLVQNGDSVTGTWQAVGDGATAAPARQLKGMIAGNKVALQAEFKATMNVNGEVEERTLTMLFDLTLEGDKLEGTMANRSGDRQMPPRPVSARRETT